MENNTALISVLDDLQIQKNVNDITSEQKFKLLVEFIDELIRNDFNRLLSILYRVDISEEKLKLKLAENNQNQTPSAEIIAKLLVEREEEKILSRVKYSRK